jgi:hypothetical protein
MFPATRIGFFVKSLAAQHPHILMRQCMMMVVISGDFAKDFSFSQ